MRILDVDSYELEVPDLTLGYLRDERIFKEHHEAVEAVEEQGHWETLAEYPNGGKDVAWVVDVPGVEAQEAWDEYEDIYRYLLYTEEELAEIAEAKEKAYKASPEYRIAQLEAMLEVLTGVSAT